MSFFKQFDLKNNFHAKFGILVQCAPPLKVCRAGPATVALPACIALCEQHTHCMPLSKYLAPSSTFRNLLRHKFLFLRISFHRNWKKNDSLGKWTYFTTSFSRTTAWFRPSVGTGATGATGAKAPVDFEQKYLASARHPSSNCSNSICALVLKLEYIIQSVHPSYKFPTEGLWVEAMNQNLLVQIQNFNGPVILTEVLNIKNQLMQLLFSKNWISQLHTLQSNKD